MLGVKLWLRLRLRVRVSIRVRSSLETGTAWPGHVRNALVITAVDFNQFLSCVNIDTANLSICLSVRP